MEDVAKEAPSSSSVDPTTTTTTTTSREEPSSKRTRLDDGADEGVGNKKNATLSAAARTKTTTTAAAATATESSSSSVLLKPPPQHQPSQPPPPPPRWRLWKAIDRLEERQDVFYPKVTRQVIEILKELGKKYAGDDVKWKSFLDKRRIYNEIEESIIAIHYLVEGTSMTTSNDNDKYDNNNKYIAVDVCGGKGYFSFLLSYINPPNLYSIILLEKATDIDWYHIHQSNEEAAASAKLVEATTQRRNTRRPHIDIWKNCNLHDYDTVLDKLLELNYPVALTGIHLCKQLSPSFVGLVNGLGREKCVYSCLAPCCLPRVITSQKYKKDKKDTKKKDDKVNTTKTNKSYTLSIQTYETQEERNRRKDYVFRRERLKHKPNEGPCFVCQHPNHNLRTCDVLPTLSQEKQIEVRQAWHAATVPCWNCLQFGHYKSNCPNLAGCGSGDSQQQQHQQHLPPMICLDVSNLLQSSENPYKTYCHLLANEGFQFQQKSTTTADTMNNNQCNITVVETELTDNSHSHDNKHDGKDNTKKQKRDQKNKKNNNKDWNSERKSIFIIAR